MREYASTAPLVTPTTVRRLQIGDVWRKGDLYNTCRGLEVIPHRKIGKTIKFLQTRDIFLRPTSCPSWLNAEEQSVWWRDKPEHP
jgi:hypothetical protein